MPAVTIATAYPCLAAGAIRGWVTNMPRVAMSQLARRPILVVNS
jgi:hypothetical protein